MQGKSGLAYVGVNALTPPDVTYKDRAPTFNDYIGYDLMHLWHVILPTTPTSYELWYLANKASGYATWIKMYPQGGAGGGNLRSDDALISVPDALGAINVWGGQPYVAGSDPWLNDPVYTNIFTAQNPNDNTLQVVLKRSIMQPKGTADGLRGLYGIDGDDFMHGYGTGNTMLGADAGNRTLNVVGAVNNTCIGYNTLQSIDTANNCTGLGYNVLSKVVGSGYLIAIGYNAGDNYTLNESSDILIGHPGGFAGEDNTIRIGQMPTPNPLVPPGNGEQNQVFIAGIWNSPAVPVVNTGLVIVDDSGQLYVDDLASNSVVMTDAAGNPIAVKGPVGTVLTGHGILPADPAPEFLPLKSPDLSVLIGVDPVDGAITLTAAPAGGGVAKFTTDDALNVFPDAAHNVNVLGVDLIKTYGAVANTIQVGIERGLDNQVISGNTGASPDWKTLTSSDGSISITQSPFDLDFKVIGVPPVGGINYLMDHALLHVPPIANGIQIEQGKNITTVGNAVTAQITVGVTDDVYLLGWLHTENEVRTLGVGSSLVSDLGHLLLPNTDAAGFGGTIKFGAAGGAGGTRWISNYGAQNVFVGANSGSLALNPLSAKDCTFIGNNVGMVHVTGESNTAVGSAAFDAHVDGAQCTILGVSAFGRDTGSSYTTCLGWHAGYNALGAANNSCLYIDNVGVNGESNCIRIGQEGIAAHHQDKCYIAGIYPATEGPAARMVVCGNDGKLSTQAIPAGGAATYQTDAGNAAPVGGILNVLGGYNIGTRAAGNTITIDVDDSIQQSITNAAGSTGVYALGTRGANTYSTNRFMHAWGGGLGMTGYNTFLGYQAGRLNAAAVGLNNTVLGALALKSYTTAANNVAIGKNSMTNATSSSNSVCAGSGSGGSLTTGGNSVLLGLNAGAAYTTENYNIILGGSAGSTAGDAGQPTDSRVMYLGFKQEWAFVAPDPHFPDPVETLTKHGTDDTYCYGIYKNSIASSGVPVYVDHYGKLGTQGGVLFAFRQTTTLANVTGDATVYLFGTSGGLTLDFDNTGSITLGGAGAPVVFTVPYSGKYAFTASITMSVPASPPVPRPVTVDPLYVFTDNLSFCYSNYMPASTTFVQYVSEIVTTTVYLDAGDHVYWGCAAGTAAQAKNISIVASQAVAAPAPVGVKTCYSTYFTGSRLT